MKDRSVHTVIDPEQCTGCGLCVKVCPSDAISMVEGKALVTGDESLNCGHCQAVCPADAVRVISLDPDMGSFSTFETNEKWLPYKGMDTGELVRLMRSRRSCRNYKDEPLSREVLLDLVKIGVTAPSGTNNQFWTYTVLPDRPAVVALAELINRFFKKLNKTASKAWLRKGMRLIGKPELDNYYHEYYQKVEDAIAEWESTGRERLFHGAPAAVLVGAKPGGSCPAEDALLATQNMLLAAHTMGLGTCLVGFAVEAMRNDPSIKAGLGIPAHEKIYAVIALGRPDEKWQRVTGRFKVEPRWFEAG